MKCLKALKKFNSKVKNTLTGAGAVIFCVFLWVALESALEAMLPEFKEPGVSLVRIWLQVQVVIIKPGDISRLQFDGDSSSCLFLIAVCHIISIGPAITAERDREKQQQGL